MQGDLDLRLLRSEDGGQTCLEPNSDRDLKLDSWVDLLNPRDRRQLFKLDRLA